MLNSDPKPNPPVFPSLSLEGLKAIHQLARIGSKAHGHNPSPVDIKLELQEIPAEMLFQIEEDTAALIANYQIVKS